MQTSLKLYSLSYSNFRTYLFAALFAIGNIVLPQLVHLIPQGGHIWLPIYFFTLVAAYKYGWRVGLLTAVASPLINSMLFGMPSAAALPAIMIKSVVLALTAGYLARRFKTISILQIIVAVIGYQLIGGLGEWALTGSLYEALQDFRIGIPGILVQIFGCWAIVRYLIKK
ncbi:MAG: ECF transporter S component [Muribaculaceae bacterium]|nr:ECF transporter S component [Muribaculaceae bacterium]